MNSGVIVFILGILIIVYSFVFVFKNLKDVKKSENFKWILFLGLGVMFVGMKIYQIKTGHYMF